MPPLLLPRSGFAQRPSSPAGGAPPQAKFKTAWLLLVLLLPLRRDIELPLLASGLHRPLPVELFPLDRRFVFPGEFVIHYHPRGGEGQIAVLHFHVLEIRLLLVRPAHCAGELVPVLLDRQR